LALSQVHSQLSRRRRERGLDVSYETVRRWVLKFGPVVRARTCAPTPASNLALASRGDIERYEKPLAVVLLVASVIWIRSARRKQIVAALTVILLLGFSLGLQGFATAANFLDLLRSISKLGILGLGMGLIVISRGIDLSEVAMMAGSWCVALTAIPRGLPPFWAAVLALTICVAVWSLQRHHGRFR
jgi:hypothetical protein